MRIKYKVLTEKNYLEYKKWILDLMDKDRKRPKEIIKSIKNSKFIIIALDWKQVVWMNQILTDMYLCSLYVNLFVNEDYRKQWIWGKLIETSNKLMIKKNIKWNEIITDPSFPWLPKFYEKYGFEHDIWNWTHMTLNKNTG